jgi:hypothetical protein
VSRRTCQEFRFRPQSPIRVRRIVVAVPLLRLEARSIVARVCEEDWHIANIGVAIEGLWIGSAAGDGIGGIEAGEPANVVARLGVVIAGFGVCDLFASLSQKLSHLPLLVAFCQGYGRISVPVFCPDLSSTSDQQLCAL